MDELIKTESGVLTIAMKVGDDVFTKEDLPSSDTKRWSFKRKHLICKAVLTGLMTKAQIYEKYKNLKSFELESWLALLREQGIEGLKATKTALPSKNEALKCVLEGVDICESGYHFNPQGCFVKKEDLYIFLTKLESKILGVLMSNPGTIISRAMLMKMIYGDNSQVEPKICEVMICKIRKKWTDFFGDCPIENVWGRGYIFS